MRRILFLCAGLLCQSFALSAQTLPSDYSSMGQLIFAEFASAPFPHPDRMQGRRYKDKFFTAAEHYSDSHVALFVPKGFRPNGKIDFVIHFHGWGNHVSRALEKYQLVEQFVRSRRNAILIVPQGPFDASDSFGGKLEDPNGFRHFVDEALSTLEKQNVLKNASVGKIILSGHSGGYQVISSILARGGLTDHVSEVWLFDALYAQTDKFVDWYNQQHGRLLNIYTEHGGTKEETESLITLFRRNGTLITVKQENELAQINLKAARPIFIYTALPHDEVVAKHATFCEFLKTSILKEIPDAPTLASPRSK